eukprot:TRINITY_DN2593_c0_g1_i1.p1 TRINITY_DN2593_c0_g1~~TRINITY_DN2593_c0_g1_i1.p1  ORF type:complete len:490 (+),score=38.33 TRINITY_DN2593_c0_g1_i1:172-1470(+)
MTNSTMHDGNSQAPALRSRAVSEPPDLRCSKPRCARGWSAQRPACVSGIQDSAMRDEFEGQASAHLALWESWPEGHHELNVPFKFAEKLIEILTESLQANKVKLFEIREQLHRWDQANASLKHELEECQQSLQHSRTREDWLMNELHSKTNAVIKLRENVQNLKWGVERRNRELQLRNGLNDDLQRALEMCQRSLQESTTRGSFLTQQLASTTKEVVELRKLVQERHQLNANLKQELEECRRSLQHSRNQENNMMEQLRSQIKRVTELYESIQCPSGAGGRRLRRASGACSLLALERTAKDSSCDEQNSVVEFRDSVYVLEERVWSQSQVLFDLQANMAVKDQVLKQHLARVHVLEKGVRSQSKELLDLRANLATKEQELGQHLCLLCFEAPRDLLIQPCGHLIICRRCWVRAGLKCPVCRQRITSYQRVFT